MLFLIFFFNPSVTTCHLPYIFALFFQPPCPSGTPPIFCVAKTPRNAAGHGKGEDCATKDFLSLPKKVLVTLIRFICSFFSTARRTNQEAPPQLSGFWLVATVAVGVCGTRFARTVLALFPPSSLRLHRPIKAGILLVLLLVFSTPSPYGHSPYTAVRHRGRGGTSIISTEGLFKISPRRHAPQLSPIFCCVPPAMLRGTAGKKWNHTEFSFGFIPDIKKEVSQINGIPPRMI